MTLRELGFRLLDTYRNAHKEAENIDIRHMISFIESQRARFLKQRLSKPMYYINENIVQTLVGEPVQLIKSNNISITIDGISLSDLGRDVLVTTRNIPKTIDQHSIPGTWLRVSPSDMLAVRILMTNHERALTGGYGKFNYNDIYGFEYNGKVMITSRNPAVLEPITNLDLRGVFESPLAAMKLIYPIYSETQLWDLEYPISVDIVDDIEKAIINEKLNIPIQAQAPETPKE